MKRTARHERHRLACRQERSLPPERPQPRDAVDLEREYCFVVLAQARLALLVSIMVAGVGMLVILAGAAKILFLAGDGGALLPGVYTAVCSLIPGGIARLLLSEADRAHRRMIELLDRDRK